MSAGNLQDLPKRFLRRLILAYRYAVAPFLTPRCRFVPSCSEYALQTLEQVSIPRALARIAGRILRCQPLAPGGFDPA